MLVISILSVVCSTWLGAKFGKSGLSFYFVSDSNKILAVATALSSFLGFKNIKLKHNKLINTVVASTFGVLCIHANSDTMRQWLWKNTLNNVGMYGSQWLIVHAIGSVICIFIVCIAIDFLRIRFLEKPIFKLWDKHWDSVLLWYHRIENKICKKLDICS